MSSFEPGSRGLSATKELTTLWRRLSARAAGAMDSWPISALSAVNSPFSTLVEEVSSCWRARTCVATMGSRSRHQSSSLRVGPLWSALWGSLYERALAACALAFNFLAGSLIVLRSQLRNRSTRRKVVILFLAAARLLCSSLGKASTTLLVTEEDTGLR